MIIKAHSPTAHRVKLPASLLLANWTVDTISLLSPYSLTTWILPFLTGDIKEAFSVDEVKDNHEQGQRPWHRRRTFTDYLRTFIDYK